MSHVPVTSPNFDNEANALVLEKFGLTKNYADESYQTAKNFWEELIELISQMDRVDTDVTVDEVEFNPDFNIDELLASKPDERKLDKIFNDADNLPEPANVFSYKEDPYTSTLLDQLKGKLLDIIQNSSNGLNADVEAAMFARENERDTQVKQDSKDQDATDWSERGFELPGGGIYRAFAQREEDFANKRLDKSRAITEESRKIAIDSLNRTLEQANQLEKTLHNYASQSKERKLNAAQSKMEAGIAVFKALVEKLKAKADAFAAYASSYKDTAQAASAIADVQTSKMKAQVDWALGKANTVVQQLEMDIRQLEFKYNLSAEGIRSSANVAAQLAASALSAVSASAQISVGWASSISSSADVSESWRHIIEE